MNFKTWSPLWSSIVDSSLWEEPYAVRVLFATMLAIKDEDHICRCNAFQLHRRANMPEGEVLECLRILSSPDKLRKENQEFDGRRIKSTDEGWLVLNGQKYKEMVQLEMKRARDRRSAKAYRERQMMSRGTPLSGESAYVRGVDNGLIDQETHEPTGHKKEGDSI